jgi:uroporphyrinogen decarboxylase
MIKATALPPPSPDGRRFVDHLMGRKTAERIPLVEYIVDDVVMQPILTGMFGREWTPWGGDRAQQRRYLDNFIEFWYRMGYDFVRYEQSLPLPERMDVIADAAPGSEKERAWPDEHHGMIENWEGFEKYPWPRVEEFDFSAFEYLNAHLPEGMGLILSHGGGVFEHLSWIMSLEGLSNALFEFPDLVQETADKLGTLMVGFYRHLLDFDRLIAIFPGDDMGYRSATTISPAHLRKLVLPWHRQFARMAHERDIPYFLHSCGKILAIMDDLIDDVGIDGKHSYEDAIIPVQEFQKLYGGRISILGGLDLNILSAGSTDDVRRQTRTLVDVCGSRGRYAIGSGNSIPSYVPVENYLAMIEEAHR